MSKSDRRSRVDIESGLLFIAVGVPLGFIAKTYDFGEM